MATGCNATATIDGVPIEPVERLDPHQPFIAAIVARPDDDMPRLVYADWLDEPGPHFEPARAEFIRVQCELAKWEAEEAAHNERRRTNPHMRPWGGNCECARLLTDQRPCPWCRLRRRERELYGDSDSGLGRRLLNALPSPVNEQGWSVALRDCFSRGFVGAVTLSWADWSAHHDRILESCPIRRVKRSRMRERCNGTRIESPGRILPSGGFDCSCPVCRGTGKVDEWVGDGCVRLTTWPTWSGSMGVIGDVQGTLADQFAGVRFELPPVNAGDILTDPTRRITEYVQAHAAELGVTGDDVTWHTTAVRPHAAMPVLRILCPACTPRPAALQWADTDQPRMVTSVSLGRHLYVDDDRGEWTVYVGQCSGCRAAVMTRPSRQADEPENADQIRRVAAWRRRAGV